MVVTEKLTGTTPVSGHHRLNTSTPDSTPDEDAHLGPLFLGCAEGHQRHHAGPQCAVAAAQLVENRGGEHHHQREAEDDHQEQRDSREHVPPQRQRNGRSSPAAVA